MQKKLLDFRESKIHEELLICIICIRYEIEKVEEFDLDDLDSVELMLTQEIYPEIELDVEEIKEKIYSMQEKKESLLTELIAIYKAY